MKKLIVILSLFATISQARPVELYESVDAALGTYRVVATTSYSSLSSLADDRLAAVNAGDKSYLLYEPIVQTVTNELDEVEVITNQVPVAVERCVWFPADDGPSIATQAQLDAQAAAKAAAAQAAQYAQLQAVVDDPIAKATIIQLEGIIDFFEIPRPVTFATAIGYANAWIEAKEIAGDWANASKGGRMSSTLLALFSGLKDKGMDEATINAVWSYMVATGQDQ